MSDKKENPQEQLAIAGVIVLFAVIIIVKIIKFVPIVAIGALLAPVVYDGCHGRDSFERLVKTISNAVVFCFSYLLLFGLPFKNSHKFYGFIPYSPIKGLVVLYSRNHDAIIDRFSKAKSFQNAKITSVNFSDVSLYFWAMLVVAFILGIATFIFHSFKSEPRKEIGIGKIGKLTLLTLLRFAQRPLKWILTTDWQLGHLLAAWFGLLILLLFSEQITKTPKNFGLELGHPVLVLNLFVRATLMIYFLVATFVVFRGVLLRLKVFNNLVPFIDLVLRPVCGLLLMEFPLSARKNIDGVVVGRDLKTGEFVTLSNQNLNYHTQIVGGSGAGKTNLIKNIISQKIHTGSGLIFLDLKADFDTVKWLTRACNSAGRSKDLKLFSLTHQELSISYNPLKRGSATELHSKIMNSIIWSEEYYRKTASHALSDALMVLCAIRDNTQEEFYLKDLQRALSDHDFLENKLLHAKLSEENLNAIEKRVELLCTNEGKKQVQGLSTDLLNLIRSSAGPLLEERTKQTIDLFESIKKGKIVYFLLDSMSEKESSEILGRLLLQDLITTTGYVYNQIPENERITTQVIIDEFASFATPNFIDFINRARGAGIGIMVAHQSRGDLKDVSDNFCDRLERNCATKLIFGTDNDEDAEYFASMIGTRKTLKDTYQMEEGIFFTEGTGTLSRREVEEFIIHPNVIKSLRQGEILRVSRLVNPGVNLTKIDFANEFEGELDSIEKTERYLPQAYNNVATRFTPTTPKKENQQSDSGIFI